MMTTMFLMKQGPLKSMNWLDNMFHAKNFFNPSPTHVALASSFAFHNNIYNVEIIAWHIQKREHLYDKYLKMFPDAQAIMIWLKSQSAESKFSYLVTISTCKKIQIMIFVLFVLFCVYGENIAKTFIASN